MRQLLLKKLHYIFKLLLPYKLLLLFLINNIFRGKIFDKIFVKYKADIVLNRERTLLCSLVIAYQKDLHCVGCVYLPWLTKHVDLLINLYAKHVYYIQKRSSREGVTHHFYTTYKI